jgi:hypothetical protein
MGSPRGPPLVLTSNGHRGEGSDDQQRSQPEDSTPRRVARGCGRSSPGAPTQPASWSEARRRLSGRSVVSDPRQQVPPTEVSSSAWSRSRSWRAGKARAVVRQYPLRQLPPCCVRLGTPGVHTTNHRCVGVRCRVVDARRGARRNARGVLDGVTPDRWNVLTGTDPALAVSLSVALHVPVKRRPVARSFSRDRPARWSPAPQEVQS